MQSILKFFLLISIFFFLNGCAFHQEKCIEIVDENNKTVANIEIQFSCLVERNNDLLGGLVTTFNPFYTKKIHYYSKKNLICFDNHIYKDMDYKYDLLKNWTFFNEKTTMKYDDFDSIPSKIVLKGHEEKGKKLDR